MQGVIDLQNEKIATLQAEKDFNALQHQDESTGQGKRKHSLSPPLLSPLLFSLPSSSSLPSSLFSLPSSLPPSLFSLPSSPSSLSLLSLLSPFPPPLSLLPSSLFPPLFPLLSPLLLFPPLSPLPPSPSSSVTVLIQKLIFVKEDHLKE